MTQQNLDFGTGATNDGEKLFSAFTKIQANFTDLYSKLYYAADLATFDTTGVTGNDAALLTAMNVVDAAGGGRLVLPRGIIGLSDEFAWGNGTNSAPSTKHNRICLIGQGKGLGFGAGQALGVTVLRYIGAATDAAKAVINIKGPLHSLRLCDLELDCNSKLGYGVIWNHVTDFEEENVVVRKWLTNHRLFTTRTGFPTGAPWGCGNGTVINPYAYDPVNHSSGGFKFTSGVNTATTLVGNPDSANIDVIGGVCYYGGNTGSYGLHLHGADSNTFYGTQIIPDTGNDGTGKSVFFEQWTGSTAFPQQNCFYSLGFSQDVGGTSGTGGNFFTAFATGDGAAIPTLANVFTATVLGKQYMSDGTSLLPTYTFASDPDTGIYRVQANTLGLVAGGLLAAYADNSGNLVSTFSGGNSSVYSQRTDAHGAGVVVGQFVVQGKDSAGNLQTYTNDYGVASNHTSGAEAGRRTWQTVNAGTVADRMHLALGLYADGVTGGDKGASTANFGTLYESGNSLASLYQPLDADLTALAVNSTDGFWAHTGAGVGAARTLTAPAAGLTISNPAGIAGNPTFALANDLAALEALSGTSTIYYRSGTDTWTAVTVAANLGFSAPTLGSALGTAATKNTGTSGNVVPLLDGTNTWSGAQTISLSTSFAVPLTLVSTNADAVAGPILTLYRDSASPANSDAVGGIQFQGRDSGGGFPFYAGIQITATNVTDTAEAGQMDLQVSIAGTLTAALSINATGVDALGLLRGDSFRIDQAATAIGTGVKTISNAADSSTNFGKYFSFSLNGTTVYVPCGTVAPT